MLEAMLLMAGSGAGPCLGGVGRGSGQGQRPPAMLRQVAVGEAQDDGFFGGQRAVVQAAEERRQSGRIRATVLPYRSRTRPGIWRGGERWP